MMTIISIWKTITIPLLSPLIFLLIKIPSYSRPHLFNCLPLLHCRVPYCCYAHEWVEAGQEVRRCSHVLVPHLYGVCQPLRTQCFRILQSPRVWEQLLGRLKWYYVIYHTLLRMEEDYAFSFYLVLHTSGLKKLSYSFLYQGWKLKSSYPNFSFFSELNRSDFLLFYMNIDFPFLMWLENEHSDELIRFIFVPSRIILIMLPFSIEKFLE